VKLKISNLYFSYNSHPILRNINFYINKKEILCILGKNGAGKSTLLKCISHILKPQSGSILIDGKDLLSLKKNICTRLFGYVPQKFSEFKLSVFDTILMGRRPHFDFKPTMKDYKIVENIIKELNLEHIAMREITSISGGELQKVIIAMVLAKNPNILLLDEPISNLDLKNQIEILNLIRNIVKNKELCGVLVVHDINMAIRFGDRFLFLKDGKIFGIYKKNQITPDIISEVYDIKVDIVKVNDKLLVIPQ